MKKQLFGIISFAFVAASMLMTSCTKEEGNIYRLKIHQYTSADKTSINSEGYTLWSDGDVIYVNGTDNTVSISNVGANYSTEISQDVLLDDRLYCFYAGNATMAGFDATTKTFTYTMPSIINYDGTKLNAPMVGANDGNDVDFENICTMLKLEFLKIPTSITITSENTAISGEGFTASYNGSSWTVTAPAATADNKTITISNNNYMPYVYVPLPAGNHKLTITATNVDTKEMSRSVEMEKNTIYPIHFAHPFSVSATKKVYFSPGNLQYKKTGTHDIMPGGISNLATRTYADGTWNFASDQWQYIGHTNADVTANYTSTIDLFCWGTSGYYFEGSGTYEYSLQPLNACLRLSNNLSNALGSSSSEIQKTKFDWGTFNAISNGGNKPELWFTLTQAEWKYIFEDRNNASSLWCKNSINNNANANQNKGIVIMPDDFYSKINTPITEGETSVTFPSTTTYTEAQWRILEKYGAVFLPFAGYRMTTDESNIYDGSTGNRRNTKYYVSASSVGSSAATYPNEGDYWCANKGNFTSSSIQLYCMRFLNNNNNPTYPVTCSTSSKNNKVCGYSVRLVRDAQ